MAPLYGRAGRLTVKNGDFPARAVGSYTNNDHFTHVDPYGIVPGVCPWWTPQGNDTCPISQSELCPSAHTRAPDGSCSPGRVCH
jgi:hypothetical protein